jgi:hypothetical protein
MTFSLDTLERRFHFDASGAAFPSAARLLCASTIHERQIQREMVFFGIVRNAVDLAKTDARQNKQAARNYRYEFS